MSKKHGSGGTDYISPVTKMVTTNQRERTCLRCRQQFDSNGPWNRICGQCTRATDAINREGMANHRIRGKGHNHVQSTVGNIK